VTPALFAAAPDPAAMVALGEAQILEHIRAIGLAPTKARNIARTIGPREVPDVRHP